MDQNEAIEKVKAYGILLREHLPIESVFLFGSYARNTYRQDSDIDVAVVVDHVDEDYFSVTPLLWRLRRQIDDRIEPILIERKYDPADFLGDIVKSGIEVF